MTDESGPVFSLHAARDVNSEALPFAEALFRSNSSNVGESRCSGETIEEARDAITQCGNSCRDSGLS